MRHRSWVAGALALGAISLGLWASQPPSAAARDNSALSASQDNVLRVVVPWGAGDGQVGLRTAKKDSPSQGVPSCAVAPDGSVLLLDRLNQRVVQIDPEGVTTTLSTAPGDAEEVAIAPDGAVALFSPLRAKVWIHDGGAIIGEVDVPRGLRELRTIALGPSRQVLGRSAHQETYRLGTPAAPQSLPAILHSKREGAYQLPNGIGLGVVLDTHRVPFLLHLDDSARRTRAKHRVSIGDAPVLSARIIGLVKGIACIEREHRRHGSGFYVNRSVVCVDAKTGTSVFERDLGDVTGPYVPRRSLAMGGTSPRLVYMQPQAPGLVVTAWDLPSTEEGRTR